MTKFKIVQERFREKAWNQIGGVHGHLIITQMTYWGDLSVVSTKVDFLKNFIKRITNEHI